MFVDDQKAMHDFIRLTKDEFLKLYVNIFTEKDYNETHNLYFKNTCVNEVIEDFRKGVKYDDGKLDWDLLDIPVIEEVIKVLMHGAKKYSRDNWHKVEPYEIRYYNAAMRHLTTWKRLDKLGHQSLDEETGLHHLAHAISCLMFIMARERIDAYGELY